MNLQQLIYAVEVYRSGSISKAAQNLYMAQPNLSTAVKELEAELGTPIFRRTPRGMELTDGGKVFMRHASDLIYRFNNLSNMYRAKEQQMSTLSLTTARSSEICISMAQYINSLSEKGLSFRIKLKESTNYEVIDNVVSGDADLGIIRTNSLDTQYFFHLIEYRGLKYLPLPRVQYCVLISKNHPLAHLEYITQTMLTPYIEIVHGDYEMPMYPFSNYKYHQFDNSDDNKKVLFVYDRGSLMDILANVYGSYVWTSTTHKTLKETYGLKEVRCDAPTIEGVDAIIYDSSRPMTNEMKSFIDLLLTKAKVMRNEEETP